ncbi:MAG: hypothetical protein IJ151_03265 [Bacteroidales bacterium]|nr:hypothetical protein [Bacteroidales bacterium]
MKDILFCVACLFFLTAACVPVPCPAQEEHELYTVFGSAEELSEEELLRIEDLLGSPLRINSAGKAGLMDSGLFTAYQAASILDYRERMGDILSVAEFALVDGIGEYMAKGLSRFLSFSPSGADAASAPKGKAMLKGQWKDGAGAWSSRVTYKAGRIDAAVAARSAYTDKKLFPPSSVAFYGAWTKGGTKVVAGDMSLRFGQGLALWSGMSLSGITSPLSLYKRAGLVAGTSAYGGSSHRGVAVVLSGSRVVFTGFTSFSKGIMPGGDLTLLLPWGQFSLTGWYLDRPSSGAVSTSGRACLSGIDLFADVCWEPGSKAIAGLFGAIFPVAGRSRLGFQVRCYPKPFQGVFSGAVRTWSKTSDESGLSVSFGSGALAITADAAKKLSKDNRQLKIGITDAFRLSSRFELKLRMAGRLRNYGNERQRTDLRADLCYSRARLKLNWRLNWVHSLKNGFLTYLEAAFEGRKSGALWLRATYFAAEKWADRLYSYERDAPGSFLIPAYYGQGLAASAYLSRKFAIGRSQGLTCYLRASYITKKSVAEVRLTLNYNF